MRICITGSHSVGKSSLKEALMIAVTGTHCTGKSTLANNLRRKKLRVIPEALGLALNAGFTINEATPIETQLWLMMKQIELEMNTPEPWVSDKCLYDSLAYGIFCFGDNKLYVDMMWELVRRNAAYDMVIYLPIEFPIVDDGIRSLDPVFQNRVDDILKDILIQCGVNYHTVTGTVLERVERVEQLVEILTPNG